ncbi:TetR/AcrR family transcriptional regulator [Geodermatophilus sp. SYSU D01106]
MGESAESDRTRLRALATQDRLYRAAADLFAEQGYEDTTMAQIADRAGTSRRTAFNHFPNKSDIPMLWVRRLADVAVRVVAEDRTSGGLDRIRAFFSLICRMVQDEPEVSRQMMIGWTAAAGPIRYESALLVDLCPLIDAGKTRGEIAGHLDTATVARTLSDVLLGAVFRWVRERDQPTTVAAHVDAGIGVVLRGLRPSDA